MTPEDQKLFAGGEEGEGIMYVGDQGIILAGFNGNHPHAYPDKGKYKTAPARRGGQRDLAIDQWLAACKGGPAANANFESQSPVTEAFLLGCIAQRMPGEFLAWDTEKMRITSSEKANAYVDPPLRKEFST